MKYPDGIGCCIWYPMSDTGNDEEGAGLCFDFAADDLDDMIAILNVMKIRNQTGDVDIYKDNDNG